MNIRKHPNNKVYPFQGMLMIEEDRHKSYEKLREKKYTK